MGSGSNIVNKKLPQTRECGMTNQIAYNQYSLQYSFKFKQETEWPSNKTIVWMIAIVEQVVLASKSWLAFKLKAWNCKYTIIAFRCDNSYTIVTRLLFHVCLRRLGHDTRKDLLRVFSWRRGYILMSKSPSYPKGWNSLMNRVISICVCVEYMYVYDLSRIWSHMTA